MFFALYRPTIYCHEEPRRMDMGHCGQWSKLRGGTGIARERHAEPSQEAQSSRRYHPIISARLDSNSANSRHRSRSHINRGSISLRGVVLFVVVNRAEDRSLYELVIDVVR